MLEILFNLVTTSLIYLAVPILVVYLKDIEKQKYRWVVIGSVAVVKLILIIVASSKNLTPGSWAPAFLWGAVAMFLGNKIIDKKAAQKVASSIVSIEKPLENNPAAQNPILVRISNQEADGGSVPDRTISEKDNSDKKNAVGNAQKQGTKSVLLTGLGMKPEPPKEKATKPGDGDEILFCHKCGFRLKPDSVFCSKCGTRVDQ